MNRIAGCYVAAHELSDALNVTAEFASGGVPGTVDDHDDECALELSGIGHLFLDDLACLSLERLAE